MSDKIKSMINALINQRTDEAGMDFHSYVSSVMRAKISEEDVHEVPEVKGFKKGDRFVVTDVQASPPQTYSGRIDVTYSDGTARVTFDHNLSHDVEHRLVTSGRMNLHHAVKA